MHHVDLGMNATFALIGYFASVETSTFIADQAIWRLPCHCLRVTRHHHPSRQRPVTRRCDHQNRDGSVKIAVVLSVVLRDARSRRHAMRIRCIRAA